MAGNGDTNDNQVLIKNTNIQGSPNGLGVTGGYNISIAGGSADGNVVDVIADSEYGEANLVINKFISGGLIGSVGTADRVGNTNNNQVTLKTLEAMANLKLMGMSQAVPTLQLVLVMPVATRYLLIRRRPVKIT